MHLRHSKDAVSQVKKTPHTGAKQFIAHAVSALGGGRKLFDRDSCGIWVVRSGHFVPKKVF